MIERNGKQTIVKTNRRIDALNASEFSLEMEEALKDTKELIIDCDNLVYISSSGLRAIMIAVKVIGMNEKVKIINVCDDVFDILDSTGFTTVCEVFKKQ